MEWMPQPIVMAMVAGLFLKFGLLAIDGFDNPRSKSLVRASPFVRLSQREEIAQQFPIPELYDRRVAIVIRSVKKCFGS